MKFVPRECRLEQITATRSLDVRYRGVDAYLTIAWPADDDFAARVCGGASAQVWIHTRRSAAGDRGGARGSDRPRGNGAAAERAASGANTDAK